MSEANRIFIFDTTLRDGEQAPGASMNRGEKLRIASILDEMGVDVIEAGFPVSSQGEFDSVRAIASVVRYSIVAGLCRSRRADIDSCIEALRGAHRKRVHTFISTSGLHMEHKLRMTPEQVHDSVIDSVRYARNLCDDVEWSCEDGTRSDREFLCRCFESAIRAGATTVNIADTVGFTMPDEFTDLIRFLMNSVPNIDKAHFSVHCHDDLGMSVANSLAAIGAGARQIECTINGLGERAGNAALEEIVMAIEVRKDLLGCFTGVKSKYLSQASQLVSSITGFQVPPNKAIVGANAFAHESGIHQHGVMRHRETYEIMAPSAVGVSQSTIVMGKHSGRNAFRMKLGQMNLDLSDDEFEDVFERFKAFADLKKFVSDEEIRALVEMQSMPESPVKIGLKSIMVHEDSEGPQVVRLTVNCGGEHREVEGRGKTAFDAIVVAFGKLTHLRPSLTAYEVNLIWEDGLTYAKAMVRLGMDEKTAVGYGKDEDNLIAYSEAYLSALKKISAASGVSEQSAR